jgi:hypothetical protein
MDAVIFWSIFSGYVFPTQNNMGMPDSVGYGDQGPFLVSGGGREILFEGIVPFPGTGAAIAFWLGAV